MRPGEDSKDPVIQMKYVDSFQRVVAKKFCQEHHEAFENGLTILVLVFAAHDDAGFVTVDQESMGYAPVDEEACQASAEAESQAPQ